MQGHGCQGETARGPRHPGPCAGRPALVTEAGDPPGPRRPAEEPEGVPRHEARSLTMGGDRATILHDGQAYTLRITRQNKLILTK